jgi:hypothetical protein
MSKFKLTEDLLILDKVILPKGSIISFDEYDEIKISTEFGPITFTPDMLKDKIELFTEELEVKVSVLDDEDEEVIKNYRLQLDVKTSRRKVREIESFLRKTLQEML